MSNVTGTSPLNARQLQGLLRGSQRTLVSVQVFGEHICSIERGLAQHFSPIWRQRLANVAVKIVHVGFPADAPAGSPENAPLRNIPPAVPLGNTPATFQGNAPSGNAPSGNAPSDNAPSGSTPVPPARIQSADPLEKNTIKYLVQWIQRGGADPTGQNALLYPQGNPVALEKLHHLATTLGIDPLIARTHGDLTPTPAGHPASPVVTPIPNKPKTCYKCGQQGHLGKDCVFCAYCKRTGHFIGDCPRKREADQRRRVREEESAERERRRVEFLERERKRAERDEVEWEKQKRRDVRTGKAMVDGYGNVVYRV